MHVQADLAVAGVVFEELCVASPVDGGVELRSGFFAAVLAGKKVDEEPFAQRAVAGVLERASDAPHERHALDGRIAEDFLGPLNVGAGEPLAGRSQVQAPVLDGREAEERQRVNEREEVVDRKANDCGEIREIRVFASGRRSRRRSRAGA